MLSLIKAAAMSLSLATGQPDGNQTQRPEPVPVTATANPEPELPPQYEWGKNPERDALLIKSIALKLVLETNTLLRQCSTQKGLGLISQDTNCTEPVSAETVSTTLENSGIPAEIRKRILRIFLDESVAFLDSILRKQSAK